MASLRKVRLGPRGNQISRGADGSIVLSSPEPLAPYRRRYTEALEHWAATAGDRVFLGQRDAQGAWRTISYRDAHATMLRLAQGLIDRGLSAERPLMILSGNDIEHALLGLAAMHIGVAYSPLSVAFSLLSADHGKLRHTFDLLTPGLVFAASGGQYRRALDAVVPDTVEIAVTRDPPPGRRATLYEELAATAPTPEVAARAAAVTGDTIAKILFTSGSTAMPKGVINTHRMLCANQQMALQAWPFLADEPPVIVDWLPWNHTFGGNYVFGLGLFNGGSFYIDNGRPMPGDIEKIVRNITDVRPTLYFTVPKGYEVLLPHLESDAAFRAAFFARLKLMFYAGAGMPAPVWASLRRMTIETTGERILTATTLGSTETAPLALIANWDADESGILGLPVPGVDLKLVPNGRKQELRVRGANITPGYWRQPELTRKAFDSEGWYCIGDAVRFADPDNVDRGLMFDGRIAEDFKLSTGTWVNVGPLRTLANSHLSPLVRDVALTGHDRDEVGMLIFPEIEVCRALSGLGPAASAAEIVAAPAVRAEFHKRLEAIAATGTGSSNRVTRAMILAEPLIDVEITDKNTLSYNVVLDRRAADIAELYGDAASARVLRAGVAAAAA